MFENWRVLASVDTISCSVYLGQSWQEATSRWYIEKKKWAFNSRQTGSNMVEALMGTPQSWPLGVFNRSRVAGCQMYLRLNTPSNTWTSSWLHVNMQTELYQVHPGTSRPSLPGSGHLRLAEVLTSGHCFSIPRHQSSRTWPSASGEPQIKYVKSPAFLAVFPACFFFSSMLNYVVV
jgi:hypothetical protein